MSTALAATTTGDLVAPLRELPADAERSRRRRTRFVLPLFIGGVTVFGHRNAHGNDLPPVQGSPLVRFNVFGLFAGVDLWRAPLAWANRTFHEVIDGIRRGEQRELER